ncbi:MAG: hypothetical protein K5777_04540 [Nitrosopumilus sp.]|nr:hypothetical protein [Nitrosopumilus sp.]
MAFNVRYLDSDLYSGPNNTLAVNAVRVYYDGKHYDLPQVVPTKVELDYADQIDQPLTNPIYQYIYKPRNIESLRDPETVVRETNKYRRYLARYGPLGDFYLQSSKENQLPNGLRNIVNQIQFNAGAKFISDLEPNREQTVQSFAQQITAAENRYPDNIVVPTIDIETQQTGRFGEKLDWAIDHGCKKINVISRAIRPNISNWIDLSRSIHKKNVWINAIGILPRYHMTSRISSISAAFLFGVHTASLAVPWRGSENAMPYIFNPRTHTFNLDANVTYPQSRTSSVESMSNDLIIARRHILGHTYFDDYVARRQGLQNTLDSIA